ncbi:hypothetical protein MOO44_04705 [Nicoliella spurrieriana]|uniref:DUF7671 domain-containing protein n=1 Tax=Nicoliella spurrieriana TaxID=2925830 RepID=A0A976RTC4_9LACO|nr:hypothetical protein [Nicoliella spurrieriana]UQS87458.1 hypothetical protein MOO44_04705 [Nicoliella spurrieriana]
MKGKYKVNRYVGVPVETDNSGNYQIKRDGDGGFKLHDWRTGKHTNGKFKQVGQIFLTENNLKVAVVAYEPVAFNHRHAYTPLQRFTSETVPTALIETAKKALNS